MKPLTSILVSLCFALFPDTAGGATAEQQAEAFFVRGLAAEQRGDHLVAENCYALVLRADPGHAGAQAKLEEIETREDWGAETMARKSTIVNLRVYIRSGQHASYRESTLKRMCEEITRQSGIPVAFENNGRDVGRINLNVTNATVADVLKMISEQTGFVVNYERDIVRLSPPGQAPADRDRSRTHPQRPVRPTRETREVRPRPVPNQGGESVSPGEKITIPFAEAGEHVGKQVTVTGKVSRVSTIDSGMTFVNFGTRGRGPAFTAVALPGFEGSGTLKEFEGKAVEITGTITLHRGKPQIVLKAVADIRLSAEAPENDTPVPDSR